MIGARSGQATLSSVDVAVGRAHRALVGAAGHRRRRGQQPDPPVAAAGDGELRGRARPRRSRRRPGRSSPRCRSSVVERGGAGRVAATTQQLGAQRSSRWSAISTAKRCSSSWRALAVGKARGVARGTGSPRPAATRAARAARSGRRRRSRTRPRAARATARTGIDAMVAEVRRRTVALAAVPMRALIVTNMYPSRRPRPALGSFVPRPGRRRCGAPARLEIELFAFAPGGAGALRAAPAAQLRPRRAAAPGAFDIVHAHFGLTAVAGAGRARPRARGHPARDRSAPSPLAGDHAGRRCGAWTWSPPSPSRWPRRSRARAAREPVAVLPVRRRPAIASARIAARGARRALGLRSGRALPAVPGRPGPAGEALRPRARARRRRAAAHAGATSTPSRCRCGSTPPTRCSSPPSARGSGSPCSRRWPATCRCSPRPVGVAPQALAGVAGALCAPYDRERLGRRRWPRT